MVGGFFGETLDSGASKHTGGQMKNQLALPPGKLIVRKRRRVLPTSSMTPEEIRVAQVVATAQQEMEIELEMFHGKYPVVERRY